MSSKQSQDYYLAKYGEAKEMLGVQADSAAIKKFAARFRSRKADSMASCTTSLMTRSF